MPRKLYRVETGIGIVFEINAYGYNLNDKNVATFFDVVENDQGIITDQNDIIAFNGGIWLAISDASLDSNIRRMIPNQASDQSRIAVPRQFKN